MDRLQLDRRQLETRAAVLFADKGFKDIIALLKNDVLRTWANEQDPAKREAQWHMLQAIGKIQAKVQELAGDDQIRRRKEAAAKRRAAAQPQT